mmetsp:Transcript_27926/g.75944  ORF Transcript_27926/g.75944 Transcript_27926/m.75944 type:complete len:445 (-) Transcript_27926:655-1989(-)
MKTVESLQQVHKVPIIDDKARGDKDAGDGNNLYHSYFLRGLDEEEIRPWSEFCADVFSYKANPPPADYFYRHYANDPFKDSSKLIRVATYDNQIVASCRIFLRTISSGKDDGKVFRVGGIGEVCTAVEHRRRGLSAALLRSAIAIMMERQLQISSLHAAPTFFPLYESLGYTHTVRGNRWSTVLLTSLAKSKDAAATATCCRVRRAEFPRDAEQLQELHAQYSENRLAGCLVRSKDYWTQYLSQELGESLFLLTFSSKKSETDDETIIAWLSIRSMKGALEKRGGIQGFQIQEFGRNLSTAAGESIPTSRALVELIDHIIILSRRKDESSSSPSNNALRVERENLLVWLKLPGFVRDEIRAEDGNSSSNEEFRFDWESEDTEMDNGWMYQTLIPSSNKDENDREQCIQRGVAALDFLDFVRKGIDEESVTNHQREHFVWPSDSF